MIRIVPINRNGISRVIEYDTLDEKRALMAMLGVTEAARIKLGKRDRFSQIDVFGDMVHYLNAKGLEVAHTLCKLLNCPYKLAMFETPREWAPEIKAGYQVVKVLIPIKEIRLQIVPEVQKNEPITV